MEDSEPSKKSSFSLLLWIPLGVFVLLYIFPSCLAWWPPAVVERRAQRQELAERVQLAGGWDAIRRDCMALTEQNTNGLISHWRDANLPPAILALKPLTVQYSRGYGCVHIRIFGIHSTGGHSTPYFGLEVDTSINSTGYKHGTGYGNGGVIGNHHSVAKQVADGIYEIY